MKFVSEFWIFFREIAMFVLIAFQIEKEATTIANENVFPLATANRSLIPEPEIQRSGGWILDVVQSRNQIDAVEGCVTGREFSAGEFQNTRCDVQCTDRPVVGDSAGQLSGQAPNHWHADAAFGKHSFFADPRIVE